MIYTIQNIDYITKNLQETNFAAYHVWNIRIYYHWVEVTVM